MRKNIVTGAAALSLFVTLVLPMSAIAQTAPGDPPAGSSFDQRLAQRKAERAIALNERDQQRLTNTCVSAQGKIRTLQQSTTTAITTRTKTYQQVDAKLWVTIGKLKLAGKDTFELEKQRAVFAEKSAAFQATAKNYQQSIDDLLVINCQADPAGFKSFLETARVYRTQLREQTGAVRSQIVDTVKPLLSGFANEMQPKASTEAN